jgi:hypothetical protein
MEWTKLENIHFFKQAITLHVNCLFCILRVLRNIWLFKGRYLDCATYPAEPIFQITYVL